jgi:hypothetical protein
LQNIAERRTAWLGREGSNLRMAESKSAALPLGYAPIGGNSGLDYRRFPLAPPVYRERTAISTGFLGREFGSISARPAVESAPVSWDDGGRGIRE